MPAEPNDTMTRPPSVAGEAEQNGFSPCVSSFSFQVAPDCHNDLPSARFKHITVRRPSPSRDCVRKIRSPQTTGVELPRSGRDTFQRMFFESLQSSGRFFSWVTPSASGPRQAGQLSARVATATRQTRSEARRAVVVFMGVLVSKHMALGRTFFRLPERSACGKFPASMKAFLLFVAFSISAAFL